MTPSQVFRLRPGQRVRWTASIWSTPVEGEILEITPQCNFLIEWDDNSRSVDTPERLTFRSFEPLGEDRGTSHLQDEIGHRLAKAGIPEAHITDILELVADGEECREAEAEAEARQNSADARAIDEALEGHHRWTESTR